MKIDWKGKKKVSSTDCLSSSVGEDGAGGDLKGFALRRRGLRDSETRLQCPEEDYPEKSVLSLI